MQVCTIVVTHNNSDTIEKCLQSVYDEKIQRVVIVDCLSMDTTLRLVEKSFPQTQIVKLSRNAGYAAANNIGISQCLKKEIDGVLILNPDAYLLPNTIKKLLNSSKKYANKGIFGPQILKSDKKTIWANGGIIDSKRWTAKLIGNNESTSFEILKPIRQAQGKQVQNDKGRKVDFVSGTCILIPRVLLETGLGFFEPYFLYYEDVEFCMRAARIGFPSFIVNNAVVIHDEQSERSQFKPIKNYYLARNHLLFVERNAPFRVKLREVLRLPRTISEHVHKNDSFSLKGIGDYFRRRFGTYAANP